MLKAHCAVPKTPTSSRYRVQRAQSSTEFSRTEVSYEWQILAVPARTTDIPAAYALTAVGREPASLSMAAPMGLGVAPTL